MEHVGVLDDDASVRTMLAAMLTSLGIAVRTYATAREFLADTEHLPRCACLVLDVRLPDMSGLELHKQLLAQPRPPAVVFVSGHADVAMAVEAMRHGAVDFLQKPFREQQLLDCVQGALRLKRNGREAEERHAAVLARLQTLTPREHDVLSRVLRGLRSKEIGSELGISTKTAEEHRSNVMHKMDAESSAALIAMCTASAAHGRRLPRNPPG